MADVNKLLAWLKAGEAIVGSPLIQRLLPQLKTELKLSDADHAQLAANFADGSARRDRAKKAGGA